MDVLRAPALALAAWLTLTSGAAAAPQGTEADPPSLVEAELGSSDGHVRLAWTPAPGTAEDAAPEFELVEARTGGFEEAFRRYLGPDRGSFLSGLEAGEHHFRLRQRSAGGEWGPWSEPVVVTFEPIPLARAWGLFGTGAFLFLCVASFLVVADRRARRSTDRENP